MADEDKRNRMPLAKRMLWIFALLGVAAGISMIVLLFTSGEVQRDKAFATGQLARILIETGAVEGNLAVPEAPLSPTVEEVSPEQVHTSAEPAPLPEVVAPDEESVSPEMQGEAVENPDTPPVAENTETPEGAEGEMAESAVEAEAAQPPSLPDPATLAIAVPLKLEQNPTLVEAVPSVGALPVISSSGLESWQYYGKEDKGDKALPAVAVIVTGLGLDAALFAKAATLPEYVSFSFTPYAGELPQQIARARSYGHEVWLDLPMQPEDFPASDPGPLGLLRDLPQDEIMVRLQKTLARGGAYVGLVATPGEVFSDYPPMKEVAAELKKRGVLLLLRHRGFSDAGSEDRLLFASRTLDALSEGAGPTPEQLLTELEAVAKDHGSAVGVVSASSPHVLELVTQWAATLKDKGLVLAPASSLILRKK